LRAIEPQTAKRGAQVRAQRTKPDYAQFRKAVAAASPQAQKSRVVQDNLNPQDVSACYDTCSAEAAFALAQRFEFPYTPQRASWLNMIEIEVSALSKQCLARRITTKDQLAQEVLAIVKERDENAVKINWQFSIDKARKKLNRHYQQLNAQNSQYKDTSLPMY
jgi:hypothetical protein